MNIDEFLDKETTHLGGKTKLINTSDVAANKEEEQDLFKQIQAVRDQISQKKIGPASKEFSTLRERYVDVTKKQMQQSQFLFDELMKINSELITNIEQQSQESLKKINLIKLLIANAKESLNKNMVDDANKIYSEIKQIYNQIPELFYEEKRKINEEILTFYILLSRYNEILLIQLFMRKKSEIKSLMSSAKEHLKSGNHELIKEDFDKISESYSQLPDGFAHDKAVIYMDILKLFSSVYLANHTMAAPPDIAESGIFSKQESPLDPVPDFVPADGHVASQQLSGMEWHGTSDVFMDNSFGQASDKPNQNYSSKDTAHNDTSKGAAEKKSGFFSQLFGKGSSVPKKADGIGPQDKIR
jgi:hypothetical protein